MANEKRLIDAVELANHVFAITMYVTGMRNGKTLLKECLEKYRNEVLRTIRKAPTVDAVEVVLCKDCKHYHADTLSCDFTPFSKYYERPTWYEDDFCSYGERRTDG